MHTYMSIYMAKSLEYRIRDKQETRRETKIADETGGQKGVLMRKLLHARREDRILNK